MQKPQWLALLLIISVMNMANTFGAVDTNSLLQALSQQCAQQFQPSLNYSLDYTLEHTITQYESDKRNDRYKLLQEALGQGGKITLSGTLQAPHAPTPDEMKELLSSTYSDTLEPPSTIVFCKLERNNAKYVFVTSSKYLDRKGSVIEDHPPIAYYCDGKVLQIIHSNLKQITITGATASPPSREAKWQEQIAMYQGMPLFEYISSIQNIELVDQGGEFILKGITPISTDPAVNRGYREDSITFSKTLKLPLIILTRMGPDKDHLRKDTQQIYTYNQEDNLISVKSCEKDSFERDSRKPEQITTIDKIVFNKNDRSSSDKESFYSDSIPNGYYVYDQTTGDHYIYGDSLKTLDKIMDKNPETK